MQSHTTKSTVWILVADSSMARFFSTADGGRTLRKIQCLKHERGRLREADFFSDKPGRIHSRGEATHVTAMSHRSFGADSEMQTFAGRLVKILDRARTRNAFDALLLIMPPHLLGVVTQQLNDQLEKSTLARINKDLVHFDEGTIQKHILTALEFFDVVKSRAQRARRPTVAE